MTTTDSRSLLTTQVAVLNDAYADLRRAQHKVELMEAGDLVLNMIAHSAQWPQIVSYCATSNSEYDDEGGYYDSLTILSDPSEDEIDVHGAAGDSMTEWEHEYSLAGARIVFGHALDQDVMVGSLGALAERISNSLLEV